MKSKRSVQFIYICLCLGLFFPSLSLAQNSGPPELPSFSDADADKDGFVGEAEFYEYRAARVRARAIAGGKLRRVGSSPQFEDLDTDKDSKLSQDEFAVVVAHHKSSQGQGQGMGRGQGQGRGMGRGQGRGRGMGRGQGGGGCQNSSCPRGQTKFEDLDTNGDGMISAEEYSAQSSS